MKCKNCKYLEVTYYATMCPPDYYCTKHKDSFDDDNGVCQDFKEIE